VPWAKRIYKDGMVKWANKWQLELNPGTCEVMHFARSNLTRKFSVNGRALGDSVEPKDLSMFVHR